VRLDGTKIAVHIERGDRGSRKWVSAVGQRGPAEWEPGEGFWSSMITCWNRRENLVAEFEPWVTSQLSRFRTLG
jgi:hypothetical protein